MSNNLEELYNHEIDPNEFENLAYNPKYSQKIQLFRKELNNRLELKKDGNLNVLSPTGYTVYNGRIKKNKFIPISKINNDPK